MHDYGKIIDFDNQYDHAYVEQGKHLMIELGFEESYALIVAENIKTLDAKENIETANVETQIVSSADGCSHLVGPLTSLYCHVSRFRHDSQNLRHYSSELFQYESSGVV
jgi:hypothetical protein